MGSPLPKGTPSSTQIYALVTKKNRILRVALNQEIAELICDYDTRRVAEALVTFRDKENKNEIRNHEKTQTGAQTHGRTDQAKETHF